MKKNANIPDIRLKLYEIIFEADTPAGRIFDIILLCCIVASVGIITIESIQPLQQRYGSLLRSIEWVFTIIFTIEYLARLWTVSNKTKYVFSFFGIIDFLSILPTYLAVLLGAGQSLMVIRILRLLRIFRVFKLSRYIGESQYLMRALKASQHKIIVFLLTVVTSVVIFGTVMYLVEGPSNGFTSIPTSIYWAIVTMTTVGYGDIAPQTALGQTVASVIMIMGYGIIAVPTGIVSAEMVQMKAREKITTQVCPHCLREGHDTDAVHCKYCGGTL